MSELTVKKLNSVLNNDYDFNIFVSDRNGHKSSVVQELFLNTFKRAKHGEPFALIRSKIDEPVNSFWFSEYIRKKFKDYIFYDKKIDRYVSAICFKKNNEDDEHIFCYGFYLSVAEKYKSTYFPEFEKIRRVVWEECIPNDPIVQDIRFIKMRHSKQLRDILSLASTICRKHKPQFIFLGNDIKENICNPITVNFNLLERLSPNCEIVDTVDINDRRYTFYFNYFDFDGAVNHWLENDAADITQSLNISDKKILPYILVTNFHKYYIYDFEKFLYISTIKNREIDEGITSINEFFKKYNAEHLLTMYKDNLSLALIVLCTLFEASTADISHYFGDWYKAPEFRIPKTVKVNSLINIEELNLLKYAQILNLKNINEINAFVELLNERRVIYSNVKIKIECERLKETFLLL